HLHQPEPWRGCGHSRREPHRDQHVGVGEPREDACLVAIGDHLTGQREPSPYRFDKPGGERSSEGDLHRRTSYRRTADVPALQLLPRAATVAGATTRGQLPEG